MGRDARDSLVREQVRGGAAHAPGAGHDRCELLGRGAGRQHHRVWGALEAVEGEREKINRDLVQSTIPPTKVPLFRPILW